MDLCNKHIMFACCYEAEYGGNFIKMLDALATSLGERYHSKVFFVFPRQTDKDWLTALKAKYDVGFTRKPYKKSTDDLFRLIEEWAIDLVHTHFESYDIPVSKAVSKTGRNIQMVWHLHDYLTLDKTGLRLKFLRKVGTNLRFWRQYGWYGKKAYFAGVSAEVTNVACHYRKHIFSFPKTYSNEELQNLVFPRASVLLNGIDMSRLNGVYTPQSQRFTFLSFGANPVLKGIPCILDAANELADRGVQFQVLLTRGCTTESLLSEKYHGKLPEWLKVVNQTEDICSLFDQADCYISASLSETMSMAIAEASIYGLPVIQSDIPGTWWNADTPSTYLFHLNDAADLAGQMSKVMDEDKEHLQKKCSESALMNKQRLSMAKWVEGVTEIYTNL